MRKRARASVEYALLLALVVIISLNALALMGQGTHSVISVWANALSAGFRSSGELVPPPEGTSDSIPTVVVYPPAPTPTPIPTPMPTPVPTPIGSLPIETPTPPSYYE